jgi:hypothetical protein
MLEQQVDRRARMAFRHGHNNQWGSVPGRQWLGCLQADDRSNDSHPVVVRFQVILDQMSGGAQCRLEIGLMAVPLHQLIRGAPDVSFRKQFRSNQVDEQICVLAQNSISRNSPEELVSGLAAMRLQAKGFQMRYRRRRMAHCLGSNASARQGAFPGYGGSCRQSHHYRSVAVRLVSWVKCSRRTTAIDSVPLDGLPVHGRQAIGCRSRGHVGLLAPPAREFEKRVAMLGIAASLCGSHTKACLGECCLPVHVQFLWPT